MNNLDVIFDTRLMKASEAYLCEKLGKDVYGPDFTTTTNDYIAMATRVTAVLPVVAVDEGNKMPIGMMVLLVTRPAIIAAELHVHPNYQRFHVGSRLVSYMEQYARGRDCIISVADSINGYEERRQAFLDKFGYRMRSVIRDAHTGNRVFNFVKVKHACS